LNQSRKVQSGFGLFHIGKSRLGCGMTRNEKLAAILVRDAGGLEGADPLRLVTITLSDGSVIAHRATQVRGQPPLFLTEEEVDKKFYDCVVSVLGGAKAEDLLKTLRRIETASNVREIFSRLFF